MGNEYRKASHTVFKLEVHVVWATKYRYKILKGDIALRAREYIRRMEFPELRKRYWSQHLWARGYFAVSVGNVTKDMVQHYLEHHYEGKEGMDSFRIEEEH